MIRWKARWGYIEQRVDWDPSKVTWTDESYWGFPTKMPYALDRKNVFYTTEAYQYRHTYNPINIEKDFGLDYYAFTMSIADCIPGGDKDSIDLWVSLVSTFQTLHPNLNSIFSVENSLPHVVIDIPGLKRYIVHDSSSSIPNVVVYTYDGRRADGLFNLSYGKLGGVGGVFAYIGEVKQEELIRPKNYMFLGISSTRQKYYVSSVTYEDDYDPALILLFSDYSPPEGGGPYDPGGPSGPGGGGGTFDDDSDKIEVPSVPTYSSSNTGFTRIYNPTLSQVQELARYLWTDDSIIQTIWNHIKQFFENPMDAIIGFNLVPVPVPDGGTKNFALMFIDTGVSMTVAANQFVDVDCGTLELKPYYGSALDYSPYTKISCFLPFIGNVSLNVDEVMGRTLQVRYRVDICSGSCVAYILVDGNAIYQYSGHCAIPIPLASADFSSYVNAAISVAKLVGAALTAGAGAAVSMGAADAVQQTNQVVTTTQVTQTARNPTTGRQITTGTTTTVETRESPQDQSSTQASFAGMTPQNVSNTVGAIMSSKPHIEHSGSFSGNSGYLGVRRPFLIIERPNMCMPTNYQTLNGFPSMITLKLGDCSGFTRVQQVQLTGMGKATNPEQAEIMELLKSGVIM